MDEGAFNFDGDYGERYEALARRVIPGYSTLFPMIAAVIDPDLPPAGRVLVVGAGTGIEMVTLKRVRPDLRIHGVDPSEQMLELAKRRVAGAEVTSGVTFQLGYAADVPPAPLFDAATLLNVTSSPTTVGRRHSSPTSHGGSSPAVFSSSSTCTATPVRRNTSATCRRGGATGPSAV